MRTIVFLMLVNCAACGAMTYDNTHDTTTNHDNTWIDGTGASEDAVEETPVEPSFRITGPVDPVYESEPTVTWTAVESAVSYELVIAGGRGCLPVLQRFARVIGTQQRLRRLLVEGPFFVCLTAQLGDGKSVRAYESGFFRFGVTAS